ncbi:glycosyltransferase family 4 protein, partial [Candidatus Bathyarchaeota archaeon]|nr:glycosyltransferase family 4 protein [Candidatus Bathyarchaeota archaeon]
AGDVAEENLPEFYAACDIFLMPSREGRSRNGGILTEGFGMVFIEANASGKPVIGGRVGGIPDAIIDRVTGLLVSPDDRNQLCIAIIALLEDRGLVKKMVRAGRRRVVQAFRWELVAQKISKITDDIAKTSRALVSLNNTRLLSAGRQK